MASSCFYIQQETLPILKAWLNNAVVESYFHRTVSVFPTEIFFCAKFAMVQHLEYCLISSSFHSCHHLIHSRCCFYTLVLFCSRPSCCFQLPSSKLVAFLSATFSMLS